MDTWRITAIALIAGLTVIGLVALAAAQPRQWCDSERALLDALFRQFGEHPVWRGQTSAEVRVVLTRNETGSWSLLTIRGPRACITAAGTGNRFDIGT